MSWVFFDHFLAAVFLLPILPFIEGQVAEELKEKRQQKWEAMFSRYLTELDSNIRLGYSLESSTIAVARKNPLFQEDWIQKELEMNVYIVDIFRKLAEKRRTESLKAFANALETALESGSNLHELMQNNMIQIQKKLQMEKEIASLLTKVKYESHILVLFVPFLILFLRYASSNFQMVMYQTLQGRVVMLVCLFLYILASYLCYYMTQVEV